jgi:hypothetical protein
MDDAIAKSKRRHAEKHRPPRTREEEVAFQHYRARMKIHRTIRTVLFDY